MELTLHSQKATVQMEKLKKKKRNPALISTSEALELYTVTNWGRYKKC